MKNLENYGVQSLNAIEIIETDGGEFDPIDWAIGEALNWLIFDGGIMAGGDTYMPGRYLP